MGYTQRGGTALVLREELAPYVIDSGADPSGLGRWSWCQLGGSEGIKTRIVSAYAPMGSSTSKEEAYWKQQVRYIMRKGLKTNPKEMFRKDLLRQLRQWRSRGERMILIMDANKDVIDGVMCRQLRNADIGM